MKVKPWQFLLVSTLKVKLFISGFSVVINVMGMVER